MTIAVAVNPGPVTNREMQSAAAPAGAYAAYRWQTKTDGVSRGHALVLFGGWRPRAAGGLEPVRKSGISPAAAHVLTLTVTADPARLEALLSAIDLAAVAALLR